MTPDVLAAAGWRQLDVDGFTGLAGPFWLQQTEQGRCAGLLVADSHCNSHIGTIHGGVVMTFADIGLGWGATDAVGGAHCATISLQTHFASVARVGEFIVCRPEVVRASKQVVFMRGLVTAEERVVASVDGIWKVLTPS